ncbi:MAG TPA: hypothetical protein V6D22_19640 [Candidatus Obscuribacterales bacterium]
MSMTRTLLSFMMVLICVQSASAAAAGSPRLHGSIALTKPASSQPPSDFMTVVRRLQNQALSHNAKYRSYVGQLHKESTSKERAKARASDMANYAMLFKGVSPSTEGGEAILKAKLPAKNVAAAAFGKQQMEDQVQRQVVSQMLEMAMGMGNENGAGSQQLNHADRMLRQTAGAAAATASAQFLRSISNTKAVDATGLSQWSAQSTQANVATAVKIAAGRDAVIAAIKQEVHHYNRHKKGALGAQRVTRTALSAASLTPSIVGPVAQVLLFGEILGTGGTEQDKLLKELYIDKRLESRIGLLTDLSHMAIYYHHVGVSTHNKVLEASSRSLLTSLVGPTEAAALIR